MKRNVGRSGANLGSGGGAPLSDTEIGACKTMRLDTSSPDKARASVKRAAEILNAGGIVAFPTETVYGLGARALDPVAVAAIFQAKGRPHDNPLIVHVDSLETMEQLGVLDDRARALVRVMMPGPLTLVVRSRGVVPAIALGGLETVALRIPDHPIARELVALVGPLVAPSANLSGRPSPTDADAVMTDLAGRIDAVIEGGPCRVGIESTVLDVRGETPIILRPGVIAAELLAVAMRVDPDSFARPDESAGKVGSPGTMYRHYAPTTPIVIVDPSQIPLDSGPRRFYLLASHVRPDQITDSDLVQTLTEKTFYRLLREADRESCDEIVVVAVVRDLPLGLRDRLTRAAGL